jgi:hypothetical protein
VIEVPDNVPVLIGQTPHKYVDLVVDPRNWRLVGNPEHGGEQIWRCTEGCETHMIRKSSAKHGGANMLAPVPNDSSVILPTPVFLAPVRSRDEVVESDGYCMDSEWHALAMMLLLSVTRWHFRERQDWYAGGNLFIYFKDPGKGKTRCYGPDFFFVDGVSRHLVTSYLEFYNGPPHQSLDNLPLDGRVHDPPAEWDADQVVCTESLGGVLKSYSWKAAA